MVRYPWDQWLDGGGWELTRGADFYIPARSFQIIVLQNIARRGLRGQLGTRVQGDRVYVGPVVQAEGTEAAGHG